MLTDFTAESVGARILKIGFFYRRVYDSRHLQAGRQEPGSAPELYAGQSSTGYPYHFHTCAARFCAALMLNRFWYFTSAAY